MMFKKRHFILSILLTFSLTCMAYAADVVSTADSEASAPAEPAAPLPVDTFTGYNHVVYHFNDLLDRAILKPIARLYNKIMPKPLHEGVTNFFSNIDNIPTVVNDVLQFRPYYILNDSWRLLINSTVGLLGFIDVGTRIGLKQHHEDFGLTLARWGYKDSHFIMIPFFGPGTIRDVIGWPIDYFFFSIYPYIPDDTVRYGIYGVGVVDRRANLLQYQDVLDQVAVDRYGFLRNAYLQHRKFQIEENDKPGDPVQK